MIRIIIHLERRVSKTHLETVAQNSKIQNLSMAVTKNADLLRVPGCHNDYCL